ncbi:MAG: DUF58 domain-containing protein [Paracoccaceae bacterium]
MSLDRLTALAAYAGLGEAGTPAPSRAGGLAGGRRGEGGSDLHDLRPFVDGDDPRRIDAAATARSGRPQVRTFHEDAERVALLVADFRRPMLWGTKGRLRSVAAAEALALEGWRAVGAGGRVGLAAVRDAETVMLAPKPREGAMLAAAGALARAHDDAMAAPPVTAGPSVAGGPSAAAEPLSRVLERVTATLPRAAAVILATGLDAPGADFEPVTLALARRCRLVVLLVRDAVEETPPPAALPVRAGGAVRHVRFAPSDAAARLTALGVEHRIVRAWMPAVEEASA